MLTFFSFSEDDYRGFQHFRKLKDSAKPNLVEKRGIENPKSGISFFRMCREFLEGIEGLKGYNGYKFSAAGTINFLLFVRLCRFKKRASALKFLEKHEEWAVALEFYKGVPHESDITKFVYMHVLSLHRQRIAPGAHQKPSNNMS